MELWIILGGIALIGFLFIGLYNRLVALRQRRENAFSDIDVQLRQRFDLVPSLVETVKGYASHEKEIFENVTKARAQAGQTQGGGSESRIKAESMLGGALMNLLAVAENYPDLKADANFQKLMAELSDIENKIAAARRFFNSATAEYNTALQQFPANLMASSFGFTEKEFFENDEALKSQIEQAPDIKF